MSGYAFRRALLKTWHGGRGRPPRFESIFSKRPHQSSKVIHRLSCLKMPYGHQIWSEEPLARA